MRVLPLRWKCLDYWRCTLFEQTDYGSDASLGCKGGFYQLHNAFLDLWGSQDSDQHFLECCLHILILNEPEGELLAVGLQ